MIGLSAFAGGNRPYIVAPSPEQIETSFRADTIFQIDTVYQYEIIYDTIYYFDSIPQMDTLIHSETFIETSDSSVIVNRLVSFKIIESKRVFTSESQIIRDNSLRELQGPDEGSVIKYISEFEDKLGADEYPWRTSTSQVSSEMPAGRNSFLTYQARDTLYRWDTIVSFETRYDTMVFESYARSDTSLSNYTEYEKYGRTVVAKEIVNVTVVHKENLFIEKPRHTINNNKGHQNERKSSRSIQSSSRNYNLFRRDSRTYSRSFQNGKSATYTSYLRVGVGFFNPELTFSSENSEAEGSVNNLNDNTQSDLSYSLSFTYNYFKNQWGFETGMSVLKQKYNCVHQFQVKEIDTSYYWGYFDKEDYIYDTTWYINIDTLLQTGDTLLVPNVDSTMILINDSIQSPAYDTTYTSHSGRYNYSFSYLEIPIIGHYSIIEKKLFLRIAAGVIPTFLVGKAGNLDASDTNGLTDVKDISFDYGFSLSAYGSCVIGYHVTDEWAIYIEPFVKRNLFTATRNDDFLMKSNAWGAKLGLSWRLFSFSD